MDKHQRANDIKSGAAYRAADAMIRLPRQRQNEILKAHGYKWVKHFSEDDPLGPPTWVLQRPDETKIVAPWGKTVAHIAFWEILKRGLVKVDANICKPLHSGANPSDVIPTESAWLGIMRERARMGGK